MNSSFGQYKKLQALFTLVYPELKTEKMELQRENTEQLIIGLVFVLDVLFKAENLCMKKNFQIAPERAFFSLDPLALMDLMIDYLQRFHTQVLLLSKTERQTFVFILENIADYFRHVRLYSEEKDKRTQFQDYKFWIENFFKMAEQKLNGTLSLNRRTQRKHLLGSGQNSAELAFSNSALNLTLHPFVIHRNSQHYFLSGILEKEIVYTNPSSGDEVHASDEATLKKLAEFLLANLCFPSLRQTDSWLREYADDQLLARWQQVQLAWENHVRKQFAESINQLNEIAYEEFNMPLILLLQIRNLQLLNRIFELKRLLQKFLLFYPFYAEGNEIMGDIYGREENMEMALSFYEKAMAIAQSKELAEKLKRVKESIEVKKAKPEVQKNDLFYDISNAVLQDEEQIMFRQKEIRQMVEILISRSKRNVLLVGDRGAGKSTLIRLLAHKIACEEVPLALKDKKIKEINFVTLLTGSKYRGQFEEKVLKLFQDFRSQNAILVLEDIHLMMSSGAARGTSLDLVNILKNFLRENSIQVIATTDYEEFKNTVEKDNSLLGFFQKILIKEMSQEETKIILKNLAASAASRDRVTVPAALIENMVEAAKRNIRERRLPDAAIMVLERCIAKAKMGRLATAESGTQVEENDLVEVMADILNLPESNISVSLKHRLLQLRDNIQKRIIGQEAAIETLASAVIASKLGYDIKKSKPDGIFLFIGPTGVGKTETALALCEALYGNLDFLIRIDMSEYMEKYTYSRFVGAAPGYVGYYDANQLTDKVRQSPYAVILLDEIEKADSQLLNIFLQVFDAGRLTDARGNVVDFSKATIIMTSNIGTALFGKANLGYRSDSDGTRVSRASLLKALKKYFSPEFLNRIDEIVVFKQLDKRDIKKIIAIHLQELRRELEKEGKELVLREEVVDYIVRQGYSTEYGARHLGRTIKKELLEKIALLSLEKEWPEGRFVVCSLGEVGIEIRQEPFNQELASPPDSCLANEGGGEP